MPFIKGKSGNPAGRKPKPKQEKEERQDLRKSINEFLLTRFDEVVFEWEKSTGKDKMQFYRDLLRYVIAPSQSVEVEENKESSLINFYTQITETLRAKGYGKQSN